MKLQRLKLQAPSRPPSPIRLHRNGREPACHKRQIAHRYRDRDTQGDGVAAAERDCS